MSFGQCHAEEIYVRVETGERFFGIDYISNGKTPADLFSELAHGTVVHEDEWLKTHPPEAEPNPGIRKARIEAAAELAMNSAYGFPKSNVPDPKVAYESYRNLIKDAKADCISELKSVYIDRTGDWCRSENNTGKFYLKEEVDAAITKLKTENERLVKCCKEYDSRQRIDDRIKFNGAQQLRTAKRALWLTRADRAKAIQWHEGLDRYLQERKAYWPSRFSFMANDEMYHVWHKCWCEVESKCRAKAEEYK